MRVVVATGIFPPDIGGPATHAADLAQELRDRGHEVVVLTLTDSHRSVSSEGLKRWPRPWPWPVRTLGVARWLVTHRDDYDVVYATGLDLPAVAGARAARRPVVLKVVGDHAWERGRRQGLTEMTFDLFQEATGGPVRLRMMQAVRNWTVRHATAVVVPSRYLQKVVERWCLGRQSISVIHNGVRSAPSEPPSPRRRESGLRLVFVGRLVAHKRVDILLEAIALTPATILEVVGDGPEAAGLRAQARALGVESRVRFTGALPRRDVMQRLAESDALVSATSYEGLPHVLIEALACGTPVVSTPAGGVGEVVVHGVNGFLVDPPDPSTFSALFTRLVEDPGLQERLRVGAAESGREWSFDRCASQVEDLLAGVRRRRPWVVFVGRGTTAWPPGEVTRRKLALHSGYLRQTSIGTGPTGIRSVSGVRTVLLPRFPVPSLDAALFYAIGPVLAVAVAAVGGRRHGVVVCKSPYEGLAAVVARSLVPRSIRPRVQIELHGDWQTASRMYGSCRRRHLAPAADAAAVWSVRRADRLRAVSLVLERQARDTGYAGPIDRHLTYSEFEAFLQSPPASLPERPTAAFVGVLERYKAVDILLDAWPAVVAGVPGAQLLMVGQGSLHAEVRRRLETEGLPSVVLLDPMPQDQLVKVLDRSTCLVLPSRSEGLPRIVLEAMARGRAVVATTVGGLDELVDEATGRLVAVEDVLALTGALVNVLGNPDLARSMGVAAREKAERRRPVAEYEEGIARLAAWARSDERAG